MTEFGSSAPVIRRRLIHAGDPMITSVTPSDFSSGHYSVPLHPDIICVQYRGYALCFTRHLDITYCLRLHKTSRPSSFWSLQNGELGRPAPDLKMAMFADVLMEALL